MNNFFLVFLLILIIAFFIRSAKKSVNKGDHFDEMQMQIRGRGYAAAYATTMVGMGVAAFLYEMDLLDFVAPSVAMMTVFLVSVGVFAVYCIARDAYFFINGGKNHYIPFCAFIVAVNYLSFATVLARGGLMKDGMLTYASCSGLMVGSTFLVVLIALLVKKFGGRKEADE